MEISSKIPINTVSATKPSVVAAPKRDAATVSRIAPGKVSMGPILIAALVSLCVGVALGLYISRQRYHAQEAVVAINGTVIDKNAFFRRLENTAGDAVIRQMVGEELQLQFARKIGKFPTAAAVEVKLETLMKQPTFTAKLQSSHLSPDDVRHEIRAKLADQQILTRDVRVTEAETRRFYEHNIDPKNPNALYYTPESAQIDVIVSATREDSEKALHAVQNGVPFEQAAAIYSRDNSRVNGGLLPPIQRGRTTKLSGIEQAIFSLKIGQQVGPIKVVDSWWLIRCLDRQPSVTQAYAQVKEQATLGAKLTKLSAADSGKIEREFADFQKHATIQAFWTRYTRAASVK